MNFYNWRRWWEALAFSYCNIIIISVNNSGNCGLCLSQRHIYRNKVESKVDILIIYSALYSEHLVEIGLYFWIWFKGQVAALLCCQLNWLLLFWGLGCNMTEVSNLLNRSKGSKWVYLRDIKIWNGAF